MKRVWHGFLNFLKLLFLTLISPFVKNKKEETKQEENITIKSEKLEQLKKSQLNATGAVTGTPDDNNMLSNPHDNKTEEDGETESTRIYTLPRQLDRILNPNEKYSYLAFTDEEIDALIDDELEDVYKEQSFKVYKANNILKKKIDKFKEEIVPKIKDKIYYNNITNEKTLKREIKDIVAEQLLLTPLIEVKKEEIKPIEVKKEEEPYFVATNLKKGLNLPEKEPIKVDEGNIIINLEEKETVEKKLETPATRMVQNTETIKAPTVASELPKLAAATLLTAAQGVAEIIAVDAKDEEEKVEKDDLPKLKEEEEIEEPTKEEPTTEPVVEVKEETEEIELPALEGVDTTPEVIEEEVENIVKETEEIILEVEEIEKEVDKSIEKEKEEDKKVEEKVEEIKKEQEEVTEEIEKKDISLDMKLDKIDSKTEDVIDEAKEEAAKHDFFEKDYESEEKKIDEMLDKISDTRIKYGNKLTKDQKERLDKKEAELRSAKDKLKTSKEKDVAFEKKELDDTIKEQEINGLQHEIEAMHLEYKEETNNNLLQKLDKLEGMTKEQVASTDRRIMMHRFNKASFLLEMSSLLAFPFIRNKYFRLFTIGLVVDNHLGFAHAFLNRKANRYSPVDLDRIKKGQDALDGAIELAYKDLVQLDYIEQQAYAKYPELATDEAYQASITRVRNNLTNQFNKLQHKQETMERYLTKGKRQRKVLNKIEAAA